MVGIVPEYTKQSWERDMSLAKSYGIDGFALNIGTDGYTDRQLALAYSAAQSVNFVVFLSFDVSGHEIRFSRPVVSMAQDRWFRSIVQLVQSRPSPASLGHFVQVHGRAGAISSS